MSNRHARTDPPLGVVVPAHQAASTLDACLSAIREAGFPPQAITVVDDGSRDGTAGIAERHGARTLRNETAQRPARARNRGVEAAATAPVIFFVDADVTVHADVKARLERHFADPGVTAVIGAYDEAPPNGGVVSRYRNLLHAYTHRVAEPEAETFWTGIGAVRRDAFLAAGGFDSAWENIEDVEFGLRLRAAGGRIVLDPELRGTHLKAWTGGSMFRTDLWGRAVPWSRLIRLGRAGTGSLNTARRHQVSAAAVLAGAACLVLVPFVPVAGLGLLAAAAAFLAANAPFLASLARTEGPVFALRALPWHVVHYVAALAGYLYVRLGDPLRRSRRSAAE